MKFRAALPLTIGLCLIAANGSMADTGIVERYKEEDFAWLILSTIKEMHDSEVDRGTVNRDDHCTLASAYELIAIELEDAIEDREIFMQGKVTLKPEEVEELRGFLEQIKLGFDAADRSCGNADLG